MTDTPPPPPTSEDAPTQEAPKTPARRERVRKAAWRVWTRRLALIAAGVVAVLLVLTAAALVGGRYYIGSDSGRERVAALLEHAGEPEQVSRRRMVAALLDPDRPAGEGG